MGDIIDFTIPTDIMVLSPCTIPLLWLQQFVLDDHAKNIASVYMMGGCEVIDNMDGYEFNQALNVKAFNDFLELVYKLKETYNFPVYIATLDACERQSLDLYNFDIDNSSLSEDIKALFKSGKDLVDKRGEIAYYIYDLTIAWKYLEEQGVYPKQFIKRTYQLKGTNVTSSDIIVPYAVFDNPWLGKEK